MTRSSFYTTKKFTQKIISKYIFFLFITFNTNLFLHGDCPTCNNSNTSACTDCENKIDCCLGKCDGYPFLQMRSQGRDSARQFSGLQDFLYKNNMPLTYGAFSLTAEYSQSFNNKKLAHFLFGTDLINCCELYIQGSKIENRNPKAWLADYFGLPEDFYSKVKFNPTIQNMVLDLNFYIGLDELTPGLFLNIDAPFTWTKWDLNQCEQVISTATTGYQAGYMSQEAVNRASLSNSFLQVMQGGYNFADMQIPMRYGKITNCGNTASNFAEIDFTVGYNFILNPDAHCGLFIYNSAPTGTRPCAEKLFEPIIGNGKHWELGAGLTTSKIFYRSEKNEDRYIGFWLDAVVGHLFKTRQFRSFDFCGKPSSRYMLLEQITTSDNKLTGQSPDYTPATYKYAQNLIPAINWSTFNIKTQISVQADISIKLIGALDNMNFDLGYNLWARTGEKFYSFATCPCDTNKNYASKGDSLLYGQWSDGISTATIIPLSQTQSCATIHGPICENNDCSANILTGNGINGTSIIDYPELAFYTDGSAHRTVTQIDGTTQINTSIQPVRASHSFLNTSQSPSAITHKIFGNFEYAFKKSEDGKDRKNIPFIGLGGNIEFSQDRYKDCCASGCCASGCNKQNCNTSCYTNTSCNNSNTGCSENGCNTPGYCANGCNTSGCTQIISHGNKVCLQEYVNPRIALSQWGIWLKGGVSFN